jgi:hypothetical protein
MRWTLYGMRLRDMRGLTCNATLGYDGPCAYVDKPTRVYKLVVDKVK